MIASLRRAGRQYKKHRILLLLLVPALVWYGLFYYAPLYGIQLAFKDYRIIDGIAGSPWVGLEHFRRMFSGTNDFPEILRNTVIISLYHLLFGFPAPIALALLFQEIRFKRFRRIVQSVSYLPHFLSWVVLAGLITVFLSPSRGVVNYALQGIGLDPIYFLGEKAYFRFTLIASDVWKEVGWGTVVYLAAIAGIDPHLYEAARVDGAGRWKMIVRITLPGILPVIVILFILRVGHVLDGGFDQVLNLYNPAVYEVGDIIDTYVYRVGINQMQYGFTTAVGLFKNAVGFALLVTVNWIVKRLGQEGLF
ncbi:ABC transporter permease [Cohnella zeiphila]|uniref:Sugar ABC transporter permease n=1 Tax=Cohnella zeiphila TaxID=2761120 RepID=A0A7X0SLZ5_9BACL|nr:ABC transporter permease subunit [Cohnella zeiphila]MBB6732326.1 sugar ABC transporter permease [Cohnella zeiphila]